MVFDFESKDVIRWGILGCGHVTELKSGPAYKKTVGFELAAVMRRDETKARDYAIRHGVKKHYAIAEDLINDHAIDAIYIATPPDSHKQYALKVADAGKPCCVEKPLAPSYNDSLAIVKAFKKKKLPLFVAYYRRSLPRFKQVKTWLDNGSIGKVRHIVWHLSKAPGKIDLSGKYNWRTDPEIAVGGYFDDLASHGLDLFVYFFGNVDRVYGISLNQQGIYPAKDDISACWLHENGVSGTGSWNFGSYNSQDRVEIYGSSGMIRFSIFDDNPLVLNNRSGRHEQYIRHPENIQLHHVENMRDHLLGKSKHPSSGTTAAHTSWIMDKILGN